MGMQRAPHGVRGELFFKQVAGCAKGHSLTQQKNSFGPQLADLGVRAEPRHIVQSIVEPDAHIVEGFAQLVIETKHGKVHPGVLIEESGLAVTLGLAELQKPETKTPADKKPETKKTAVEKPEPEAVKPSVAKDSKFALDLKAELPRIVVAQPRLRHRSRQRIRPGLLSAGSQECGRSQARRVAAARLRRDAARRQRL